MKTVLTLLHGNYLKNRVNCSGNIDEKKNFMCLRIEIKTVD